MLLISMTIHIGASFIAYVTIVPEILSKMRYSYKDEIVQPHSILARGRKSVTKIRNMAIPV